MFVTDYGFPTLASHVGDKVVTTKRSGASRNEPKTGGPSRIRLLAFVLILFAVGGLSQVAGAAESQSEPLYVFAIPAQPLSDALEALADQTGALMIVPFELAESRQANEVFGHYTLAAALDLMLTGTGLSGDLSEKRVITVTAIEEKVMPSKKKGVLAGIIGTLFATSPVVAQEENHGPVALEEVIVTAQKREQNSQDVGKSVNVFGSEALDRGGVNDVSRLELITPGLAFAQRGNDYKLTLRGANAENTDRAEPVPIGVFVDGVYRVRAAQAGNAFLDVASVEVLKGPQGTLFGRNTLGGAVLITTNRPSTEGNAFRVSATGGNYGMSKIEGVGNWAVSDAFAFRVAAAKTDADGWIENLGSSNDLGEVDDLAVRVSAAWDVSDSFSVLLSHFHYDSGGSALGAYGYQSRGTLRDPDPTSTIPIQDRQTHAFGIHDTVNPRGGALGTRADLGPWEIYRDSPFVRDVSEDTTILELLWDLDSVSVKSLTSVTDYHNLANVDGDYSEGRLLEESRLDDMEAMSQELLVSSATDGALEWVGGLYYAKEEYNQAFFRNWLGFAGTAAEAAAGTPNLAECGNAFSTVPRAAVADANDPTAVCPGQFAGNPTELEASTIGVFLHGNYSLSDTLRVSAGVRYSEDDKDYLGGRILRSTGVLGETVQTATLPANNESWDQVTWELGFEADVLDDSLLFGSVSTGFLSGSFNPNGSTFDQQEVTAYEVGMKNRLLDDRVELNLSLYRNEFSDMLAGILDAQSLTQKVNGGSINANGLEVDLKALVTDRLTMNASMSLQDSTYDTFGAANRFQLGGTGPVGFVDLSGRDTPWAPSVSGNLSVSYDIDGSFGLLTPHIQIAYSGSHWTTGLQQFDLAKQSAYAKVDARLFWRSPSEHWTAQAYVQNLTNEAVLQHTIVGGSDIIQVSWGKPRMYGLRIGYEF